MTDYIVVQRLVGDFVLIPDGPYKIEVYTSASAAGARLAVTGGKIGTASDGTYLLAVPSP